MPPFNHHEREFWDSGKAGVHDEHPIKTVQPDVRGVGVVPVDEKS